MSRFRLNRFFSRPLTLLLLKTPLTPNQITSISLGFGVLAGILFSRGSYGSSVAAAMSYQLAVVLDNCDGEVARAKNKCSVFGGWFDVVADFLTDSSIFLGIALGMLRQNAAGPIILFMTLCLSGSLFHFSLIVFEKLKGFGPAVFDALYPERGQKKNIFLELLSSFREGNISWVVVLFAVIGQTSILFWTAGVYMQLLWMSVALINFRNRE